MSTVINLRHWAYCAGLTSEGTSAVPATVLNSIADQLEAAQQRIAEYDMSAGHAHQRRCESRAVREELGFGKDADDVAPIDLCDAIKAIRRRAEAAEAELARRDAAAGEPVLYQVRRIGRDWENCSAERYKELRDRHEMGVVEFRKLFTVEGK